ncbi:MAG TPA: hypothetical protein G4N98_07650 [Thermoflexia bacterium]|nr:hypothetical protein [Thermoflexia bacterium]
MRVKNRAQTPVEFFSQSYRLSCTFDARRHSLGDLLYATTSAYLMLDNAYISPIDHPSRISADYPRVIIIKESLTFALTTYRDDALRRDQKYGSYLGTQLTAVFITLPHFDISGELRIPGRFDPRVLLSSQTGMFITLLNVTARLTSNPEITYHGEAAIVNKNQVSFMGLSDR